jgi:hypothetical protein
MTTIEALEKEVDRFIESLNGLSGNEIVALLPRVRRVVEKLDANLPLAVPGEKDNRQS